MFKTLMRTIWRNALRRPVFTGINLLGLSLGIACSFIMLLYVQQEWSYDKHFPKADKVFRIGTGFMNMGAFAISQEILRDNLLEKCKDVAAATRITSRGGPQPVKIGEQTFIQEELLYVDSTFFDVFAYTFEAGQAATALQEPNSVVITADLAEKYFGKRDVMGEYLAFGEEQTLFQVSGVVEEQTQKSHLPTGMWLPIYPKLRGETSWMSGSLYNYVRLHDQAEQADLEAYLDQLQREDVYPQIQPQMPVEEWLQSNMAVRFYPQPLPTIYLSAPLGFELSPGGNPVLVNILAIIGLIILLMASFNYINLTTAVGIARAKEVGVKKTLGAGPFALKGQFLLEAILFSVVAASIATGLAEILLYVVEKVTGNVLIEQLLASWKQALLLLGFALMVGSLSGLYPAFFLTRFKPIQVLKGQLGLKKQSFFRGGLIVLQFTMAAFLLIGTFTVYQQFQYMNKSDKGFQHQNVMVLYQLDSLGGSKESFRQLIGQHHEVLTSSFNSRMPAGRNLWQATYKTEVMANPISITSFPIDEDYLEVMGMQLVEGRNFSKDLAADSSALILNESAVAALELTDPIGKVLNENQRIVGVVKDFHFQDFHHDIAPAVLNFDRTGHNLTLKLKGNDVAGFLSYLEGRWAEFVPGEKMAYYFLDENLAALSEKEAVLSKAIAIFSVLAIFIACLGLLGLAVFMTTLRTKEMGIRKILGASISSIVGILAKDFLLLITLAALIAIPLAYWGGQRWLADFAFRIDLEWWLFVLPALAILLIAWLTVSYHSLRLARTNPVDALHVE
ncbi:MAG: ABC transporter permease [Saprospiraceae bacterium]